MPRWRLWFHRFTSAYFFVTAGTGLVLYFRGGVGRPGWFSDETKEVLVALHNGEWVTAWAWGRPVFSGVAIGGALAFVAVRGAWRVWAARGVDDPGGA